VLSCVLGLGLNHENGRSNVPIDEVLTTLENAILEATQRAEGRLKRNDFGTAQSAANVANTLAQALAALHAEYNRQP
jgi:hypothetical protein